MDDLFNLSYNDFKYQDDKILVTLNWINRFIASDYVIQENDTIFDRIENDIDLYVNNKNIFTLEF